MMIDKPLGAAQSFLRFCRSTRLNRQTFHSPLTQDHRYVRQVNMLRFLVPSLLSSFVIAYESTEHGIRLGVFDVQMMSEILYFGVLNPALVFVAFSHVGVLLRGLSAANHKAETLNLNLEQVVAERTAALTLRNQELGEANFELQKLDQMKSDFVAMVSHGLRGPLTNLSGALEIALQEASHKAPPELHRILIIMAEENGRLARFSQMVLDISRIDAGKMRLNLGPVAVKPLLKWVVSMALAQSNRQVRWVMPDVLPPVLADEVYLAEILSVLLDNADKYTPPCSPLDLEVAVDGTDPDRVLIMITDYGPGIAAPVQDKIFDRFFRFESPDHPSMPGWGLGLYFAKILTEMHGGDLTLTSPVHEDPQMPGARFVVALPIAEEGCDDG